MPHVRRRMLVRLRAAPDDVRAATARVLEVTPATDGSVIAPLHDGRSPATSLRIVATDDGTGGTQLELDAGSDLQIPFFGWFIRLLTWLSAKRALRHSVACITAEVQGSPPPAPLRSSPFVPPARFSVEQAARIAALSAVGVIASFGSSLFTQNGDAVTRAFDRSDQALSDALAIARIGVLITLVSASLADRFGRRRVIIAGLVGIGLANLLTAVAPSFEVFTAAQVLTRAFGNATLVVTSLAVIEEAPDGARAFAFSMFGLSLGLGFGLSVGLLPVADISSESWRVAFAISALSIALVPRVAAHLRETTRFTRLDRQVGVGALKEPFDKRYGGRFLLLGLVVFLVNLFSAPSSQLTNRYLTRVHSFSNSKIALLRGVTAGVPGVVGVILAGRLAESRGRRVVICAGLLIATLFQMAFFLGSGVMLWIGPTVSIVAASCAGIGLGTANGELFPTEARATSNGFLLVAGVAGAALGLVLATRLKDFAGGLGPAIALCGIAPLIAALFIVPRLPETRDRTLDEISPSELAPTSEERP